MKIVKIINSSNGKITLYDDDTYILKRRFKNYLEMKKKKEDLLYNLIDSGFFIKSIELQLDSNNRGIIFILNIKMKFYK